MTASGERCANPKCRHLHDSHLLNGVEINCSGFNGHLMEESDCECPAFVPPSSEVSK